MQDKFCENCSVVVGEGHKCCVEVDKKYFEDVVLHEYFVVCGLCRVSVGLKAMRDGGWKRLSNKKKLDFNRGFICGECSLNLGL